LISCSQPNLTHRPSFKKLTNGPLCYANIKLQTQELNVT